MGSPITHKSSKLIRKNFSANNNWETNYATLTKSNENSPHSSKSKQRDCGESARDSLAYSCLLKNELLGTAIEDIKNISEDKLGLLSNSNRGLFKYQSPTKQVSFYFKLNFVCS
jgi:cell division cycle 20-like protein 1 (cofactor of APC complex)